MTEGADIKEALDLINSSPGWEAFGKGHEDCEVQGFPSDLGFDPIPVTVVTYYPCCDCGEPALVQRVLMSKELMMYGYRYMETCYECGVVSSD